MVEPANERGWGWPGAPDSAADRKYRRDHLTWVEAGGIRLLVRKEVAPLFVGFIRELTAGGYRLNGSADDWGYANRDVRGAPGVKSNHAWGLAVDLNATTNPMTNDGRNHTDMPPGISRLAAKYGLRWGGDYSGRKDPMHFEFIGTPADAQEYVRHLSKRTMPASERVQPKEFFDMDEATFRRILREEVDRGVRIILRGEIDGKPSPGHPHHLDSIRGDLRAVKADLQILKES